MASKKGASFDHVHGCKQVFLVSWLFIAVAYYSCYYASPFPETETLESMTWERVFVFLIPSCLYSVGFWISGVLCSLVCLAAYVMGYTRTVPRLLAVTYGEEDRVELVWILKQDSEEVIASAFTKLFPAVKGQPFHPSFPLFLLPFCFFFFFFFFIIIIIIIIMLT